VASDRRWVGSVIGGGLEAQEEPQTPKGDLGYEIVGKENQGEGKLPGNDRPQKGWDL
jgi:hypothetical protein